jgi:subtilisin family serine protease
LTQVKGPPPDTLKIEIVGGLEAVAGEALVRLSSEDTQTNLNRALSRADASDHRQIGAAGLRLYRLRSSSLKVEELVKLLSSLPGVEYAEPNYIVRTTLTPNDTRFGELWGLHNTGQSGGTPGADISAVSAWDVSTGSSSIVVGVIDTGVDYNHPDLAANIWSAPTAFTVTIGGQNITCPQGSHGFNAINNTCTPLDDNNHGTHCSGTIGAVGNNSQGVVGVNWVSRIMGLKFLNSSGSGSTADAIDCIEFAVQAKQAFSGSGGANVRVLSNSWGGGGFSQALLNQINRANTNDMLFVAAAGNNGSNNDSTPHYPSSYNAANVVAVASTTRTDARSSFSNYGATSVDLGAPGSSILSTVRNGGYSSFSGTSMATPHVSGAAALVLSECALNTAALKSNILNNVDLISSMSGITVTGGRLNVDKGYSRVLRRRRR